jgi:hypothetical protein
MTEVHRSCVILGHYNPSKEAFLHMKHMKRPSIVLFLLLVLSALSHASVVYSFSGTYANGIGPVSFTVTVPNYITLDTGFTPGAQMVCDACDKVDFFVDAVAHGFTQIPSNAIGYEVTGGSNFLFFFAPQSFTVNGTYTDVIGNDFPDQGTLIVSATPVPEPSSMLLMGTGVLGVAGMLRRKISL